MSTSERRPTMPGRTPAPTPGRARERGVVLIFTLIILLILTIGAVALMKSMNYSLFSAGNLTFRSDLVNQGEQAVAYVLAEFQPGGALVNSATTNVNQPSLNYSATTLPANTQGVPTALFNNTAFAAVASASDITGATSDVKIRYIIDRLCSATGASLGNDCVQSTAQPTGLGIVGGGNGSGLPPPTATVYRLTVRVTGLRGTQVFLQTSFTKAD